MFLDLEILRIIWWALLGVLLIGFAVTDGFDMGVAALLPWVARTDIEKRIVLNTIGPFWEGNQVWIVLGAGAIFAAWPFVYAVAFSGFYLIILLLLLTMGISRPVSFKYRSKLPNLFWRQFWDCLVVIGGVFPAVIFGILVGNVLTGVPFLFDNSLRIFYSGTITNLFHPFAWLCGLLSLAMFVMHGGLFLAIKTDNPIRARALRWSRAMSLIVIVAFAVGGFWTAFGLNGYEVVGTVDPFGYSNPLHKHVILKTGAWLQNYFIYPYAMLVPALGFAGALGVLLTANMGNSRLAFICSGLSMTGIIGTVGVSMFPFLLPSSADYASSLLVWDASSTQLTLLMMLVSTIIFLPLILVYTAWVYRALRGKVRADVIENDETQHQTY